MQNRIGGGGGFCTNTPTMTIDTSKQQSNMQELTSGSWQQHVGQKERLDKVDCCKSNPDQHLPSSFLIFAPLVVVMQPKMRATNLSNMDQLFKLKISSM